jgi:hypothetical protein
VLSDSFLLIPDCFGSPEDAFLPLSLFFKFVPLNPSQKAVLTSRSGTVNVIIVLLDMTILGLEYSGLYDIQTVYKGLVYSVKLKLEFSILNRLVELTQGKLNSSNNHNSNECSVQLDTFDEQRLKRMAADTDKEPAYKAYITSDGAETDGGHNNDSITITTTQVAIHSESSGTNKGGVHRYGDWRDNDRDLESLDGVSVGNGAVEENRARSSASSQVQLARVEI